uniref:Uncharacterized protein n=1 Tax=Chrysemys picta bellii TaxID=8478 RepID=A0A8C3IGI8_CHRPI
RVITPLTVTIGMCVGRRLEGGSTVGCSGPRAGPRLGSLPSPQRSGRWELSALLPALWPLGGSPPSPWRSGRWGERTAPAGLSGLLPVLQPVRDCGPAAGFGALPCRTGGGGGARGSGWLFCLGWQKSQSQP